MISSISSNNAADNTPAASSSSTANISEVNSPFGELFIQNLDSSDPTVVGWDYGNNNIHVPAGMTLASLQAAAAATSAASTSTTPSTSSATTANSASSPTTPATTAPAAESTTSTTATTTATSSSGSSSSSGSPVIPGINDNNPNDIVTAQQVFGNTPWVTSAGGTGPTGNFNLNPEYFATQQTAQTVAQMLGGTVVSVNEMAETPGNPFSQNVNNEMIQLSNGEMINAGLVAGFFSHGYSLGMVQTMIQNEVTNVANETGVKTV